MYMQYKRKLVNKAAEIKHCFPLRANKQIRFLPSFLLLKSHKQINRLRSVRSCGREENHTKAHDTRFLSYPYGVKSPLDEKCFFSVTSRKDIKDIKKEKI